MNVAELCWSALSEEHKKTPHVDFNSAVLFCILVANQGLEPRTCGL
jgi:hypothetical protein